MNEQMNRAVNERDNKPDDVMEIDLKRLWRAVWNKIWVVGISAILCAAIAFMGTFYLITPLYQSSAMFYVNNSAISMGDASLSISQGDITASKDLVESYIVIMRSRGSLNDVIDYAGVDRTYGELREMISAAAVNSTEIFEVVVTSPDPEEAEEIANAIAYVLPKRISSIIEGTSAKVVDYAIIPSSPSSPSYVNNTVIGLLIGLLISVAAIVLFELFDITIRSEEDVEQCSHHPILAAVPDMSAPSKGGYYSAYGSKKSKKKSSASDAENSTVLIGDGISFAASEAYKLLRTKLQFSFTDESTCRVIGISSALAGEGKSLTSINIAYSLAQLNKRVLLIDCDMRRPSISTKIAIQKTPGLSNYLTGNATMKEVIQFTGSAVGASVFSVIAAGRNPPNPMELLSSEKMEKAMEILRESFDYIILDLPPVGEVSDAMAGAKLADGVLLIACQNYGNRIAFTAAVNQFEFIESRILGVVLNRASDNSKGYGYRYSKRYYKRYGYRSRYGYGYYSKYAASYAAAANRAARDAELEQIEKS